MRFFCARFHDFRAELRLKAMALHDLLCREQRLTLCDSRRWCGVRVASRSGTLKKRQSTQRSSMKKFGYVLVLCGVLGSCSLVPTYERPATTIDPEFVDAAAGQSRLWQDAGWRDFFVDRALRQLIDLALRENRDLRLAVLKVEQARLQHGVTRASLLPSVDAEAGVTRQKAATQPDGRSQWQVQTSVGYEIDLFGRVHASSQEALEQFLATQQGRDSAQLSLVAQVATQYLQWREAAAMLKLAQQTGEMRQQNVELYRRKNAAGEMAEVDLRAAEAESAQAQVQVLTEQQALRQAEQSLIELVGTSLPAKWSRGSSATVDEVLRPVPAGLKSDLLWRRPDVQQAEHELKAAFAGIGVARAALFPSIRLTTSGAVTSPQLSEVLSGSARVWSIAPQVSLPLFDAGKRRAEVKIAENLRQQRVASYQRSLQRALREVNQALLARRNDGEQVQVLQRVVHLQQQRLDLAQLRYQSGEDSYLQVLSAQQQLFSAQQQLIQTQHRRVQQELTLYQALGGGWK